MRYLLPVLLAACAADPGPADHDTDVTAAFDPLSMPLDAPGPWSVGYRTWSLTYAPMPGEARTIGLSVWYPTATDEGDLLSYAGISPAAGTLGDAPPIDAPPGGFPLVAYSHGDQGYGGTSADLMRWLASHGFVAVAPDHTDNLLFANVQPTPVGHWYHRPRDVAAVVDALGDLPDDDPLAGRVDTDRWVVLGHSRGASTVWTLAGATFDPAGQDTWCGGCDAAQVATFTELADARVVAAVPLAGGFRREFFGESGERSVEMPIMLLSGSEDGAEGHAADFTSLDEVDLTWVELEGGCHQTFALGAPCGTLETGDGFRLVNTYALAFVRRHLLGDDASGTLGVLDGSVEVDPRATVRRTRD